MPSSEPQTVGDYVSLQRGSTYKGDLVGQSGPPLLGLGSIEPGGGFRRGNFKTFGGECPAQWMVPPGSIYVALKGATKDGSMVGSVARLPVDMPAGRLTQDTARLDFLDQRPAVAKYLYWVLRTPAYRDYCAGRVTGSASASFSREDFLSYPVPPLTERGNAIVQTLEAFEEKIEQNHRVRRGLEELAQATYKAWFVDFEPVKAKAAGQTNFPGMPAAAFTAVPDRLVDSPVGALPIGWDVVDVYKLAKVVYGAPFASRLFNDTGAGTPLIRIRDLSTHSPSVFTTERHPKATLIRPGDIVVGMDGEFRLHYWTGPEAWLNQRLCSFQPHASVPTMYLGEALRAPLDYVERSEAATTVIHLGKYDIDRFQLVRPDTTMLAAFDQITSPILERVVQTAAESSKLSRLRDYLLPRLVRPTQTGSA
jgi:type I restriction enzyme, S subunit